MTSNIVAEIFCLMSTQKEVTFCYLRKYVITGRIGVQYQKGLDPLYLIISTRPQKGRLWYRTCRLNGKMALSNGYISSIWSNYTPCPLLITRSRVRSMRIQHLTSGSRAYCRPGIELFQGWNGVVFMWLLSVRVEPRRNTGIPPINFALRYQKQKSTTCRLIIKLGVNSGRRLLGRKWQMSELRSRSSMSCRWIRWELVR